MPSKHTSLRLLLAPGVAVAYWSNSSVEQNSTVIGRVRLCLEIQADITEMRGTTVFPFRIHIDNVNWVWFWDISRVLGEYLTFFHVEELISDQPSRFAVSGS